MSGQEKSAPEAQQVESLEGNQEEDLDAIMQELETLDQTRDTEPPEEIGTSASAASTSTAPAPAAASAPAATESNTVPMRSAKRGKTAATSALGQSLTLELTGTLNLKLAFVTGAKSVELICTDDALVCRFGDGTEVRIPTENPRATSFRRTG